jgi:hypothetical protein
MGLIKTALLSGFALTAGAAALGSTTTGTGFVVPTSLAAVQQDATAVCDRIPSAANTAGVPALTASLSNTCYGAGATVNSRLNAGLADGGSALVVPDDGRPILVRFASMTENVGARISSAR